jgi:hypothetical protein
VKSEVIDRDTLIAFCLQMKIPTKDYGLIQFRPSPTQVYVLDQIISGIESGCHHFVILKCRQARCTTICLTFVLYWCFKHEGIIGHFIADNDKRRIYNKELVSRFIKTVEHDPDWHIPFNKSNKELISFLNGSLLSFSCANTRNKGSLGISMGVSLVHATECARWTDEEGLKSLYPSLSRVNPNRLYIFESTARGHNLFKKMWDVAKSSVGQKAIFIGWWLHELYRFEKDSPEYEAYWTASPALSQDEERWTRIVKNRYGVDVGPERIAWWRYTLYQEFHDDLETMYQEYPPYPEVAFQFSGSPYITKPALTKHLERAAEDVDRAKYFRFHLGETFRETRVEEVAPDTWCDLVVWSPPREGTGIVYAIGVDPIHGANENSDNACIEIFRSYSDRFEQCAEFCKRGIPAFQLAWITLYLCGAYSSDTMYCVELQGGGQEVEHEINRCRNSVAEGFGVEFSNYFQGLQTYTYTRPDAVARSYSSKNQKTTSSLKATMMEAIRDWCETGRMIIRSTKLVYELSRMVRLPNGVVEAADSRFGDDRVMATGIALNIYNDHQKWNIGGTKYSWNYFEPERKIFDGRYTESDLLMRRLTEWKDGIRESYDE